MRILTPLICLTFISCSAKPNVGDWYEEIGTRQRWKVFDIRYGHEVLSLYCKGIQRNQWLQEFDEIQKKDSLINLEEQRIASTNALEEQRITAALAKARANRNIYVEKINATSLFGGEAAREQFRLADDKELKNIENLQKRYEQLERLRLKNSKQFESLRLKNRTDEISLQSLIPSHLSYFFMTYNPETDSLTHYMLLENTPLNKIVTLESFEKDFRLLR